MLYSVCYNINIKGFFFEIRQVGVGRKYRLVGLMKSENVDNIGTVGAAYIVAAIKGGVFYSLTLKKERIRTELNSNIINVSSIIDMAFIACIIPI